MSLETWPALIALVLAAYFTTLHLALNTVSRSALLRRLTAQEKDERGKRLLASRHACDLAITLLRTTSVLAFFTFVLADAASLGVHRGERVLRVGVSLFGSLAIVFDRSRVVASHTVTGGIHDPEHLDRR